MVGYDEGQRQLTTSQYALAGAMSGIVTRLLLQPCDVVKIRLQIQLEPTNKKPIIGPTRKYRGLFQSFKIIAKEEGIQALWKGHVPAQILSISYGCAQFASFEVLTKMAWKTISHKKYTDQKPVIHFICGGLAGCFSSVLVYPIDVVRTRLVAQGEPKVYNGLYQAVTAMYCENGIRTFYQGLLPTMIEIIPQTGMHFAFYTRLQIVWREYINSLLDSDVSASESLFCGAMSGTLSKIIIHPLDVVKKRLQIDGFAFREDSLVQASLNARRRSAGMINCIMNILRNEGILAFYKGLKVNIIKGASSVGVSFMAYEQCCKYMKSYNER
ncbi:mitochondrial thiamine pyrophosphate carrier-like [Dendronephthya gigantea]|uniref:mitochondrial thiamine pyrophosphate carrier-like n=1 Tax=Dendronephthya gigantea TaxID=151771 RepID=UPI0010696BD2|nr:mitochondrial thiamine pyrophosphate carrier-like [Dendronephthya gigantea]XP_028407645.1 mitochondrial thiamine pyrophosphate carrier-like [Dendronephthya gigantea]